MKTDIARRNFMGKLAVLLGYAGLGPLQLSAQGRARQGSGTASGAPDPKKVDYDKLIKLANNENPYGPPESVLKAMNDVWKYANRYGYPDGGIRQAIAEHHGVKPENVLISAGSGEILKVVDTTYLPAHKYFVGPDPTYDSMYRYVTDSKKLLDSVPEEIPVFIDEAYHHFVDNPNYEPSIKYVLEGRRVIVARTF